MIDYYRINNEPSLSESSISERESVQDVASDHETSQPPTKRSKQRASGFDSSWKQDFPWVTEVEGGMMCSLCIRHMCRPARSAIGSAPWVDVPCTWIARDSLNRHQRTETHSQAKLLEANRLAPRNLVGQLEEMGCLQKSARIAAFKNLYWLMKQEVPHTTNYLPLNDLVKLQGCSILANMNQGQNNKGESQRFVQEAVLAMGNIIRQDILTQAIDSPWYTIMVDETTDISVISEMTVYIRFLKDGRSQTRFLSILPLNDCKAETITTSLTTHLRELHLPLDRMCAFGSDGAPVMVGSKNGVAAQLRKLVPHLINNHCVAHRLALAAGQAANGLTYMLKFKDIIGDLYRFYAKSAVRTRGLHEIQELLQEPDLKLVEAKDVRWLSHDKATTTLRRCLPSIYKSLDREAEERNDARAAGLAKFSQNYQFVLTLHMMCDVLPHLSDLSKAMQAKDAIYTCIKPLVLGTLAILQGLLNTPGEHFQAAPDRVARLHADGFGITVPTEEQVQHFTDKLYRPFVQQLMSNIEERFPDLPLLQLFEAFQHHKVPHWRYGQPWRTGHQETG
ncbi:zinc finger protein 862-like [Dreissena polymorpha]|uniref:zinc finger protein 862-like n=1 Tax=Dreissena polymorpha TaxID=45954 RepID=UPI0022650FE4|nr:zinc finger protein 862-like [Dreissena polymorpha]